MGSFVENLKRIRLSKRLSQSALAKLAGFEPSAISHFEQGRRNPSMNSLTRLAEALNVSTNELLGIGNSSINMSELEKYTKKMSAANLILLIKFAKIMAEENQIGNTKFTQFPS